MLSKFIGFLLLAFATQADEGAHWLMKRALAAHDLNDTELDDTACAKAWTYPASWSTFRRPGMSLKQREALYRDRLAMQQQFTGMVVDDPHVSPFSVPVPEILKKTLKQHSPITPWQPHAIFPYAVPKKLKALAKARTSRGGGHHQKMVHRRRFPWSKPYPRIIRSAITDDEDDAELLAEAAEAARAAARHVMEQGTLTGPAMAADAADAAAERAKARVRARRSVAAAARANTSDGLP